MHNILRVKLSRMFSSGDSQKGLKQLNSAMQRLLNKLRSQGVIQSEKVYEAMSQVDRGDFSESKHCYEDWYNKLNKVLRA